MQFQPPPTPSGHLGPDQQPSPQQGASYPQWQPQTQQQPLRPPVKRRSRRRMWLVIAVVVVFIIVIAAIAGGSHGGTTSQPASTPSTQTTQPASQPTTVPTHAASTPTSVPTQKPAPSFVTFSDGTYQVGKDIQPGTYRTRTASPGCYYERLSGFGGTVGDIIANNNTDNPAIVTIKATDKGFDTQGCGTWTSDLSQITASKTSFGDGMYIVGTDITPGTYKNSGGSSCYYARLSGFANSTDDIVANNNVTAPTIVSISASDKGFESQGCGTWTKI
jgi:hypothetical protein